MLLRLLSRNTNVLPVFLDQLEFLVKLLTLLLASYIITTVLKFDIKRWCNPTFINQRILRLVRFLYMIL